MAPSRKEALCITGLGGRLGRILARTLGGEYRIIGLGRRGFGSESFVQADISCSEQLRGVFDGMDAVVHLAAWPFADDDWTKILPANVAGTYNVLEEVRRAGVRRFVFASSLSAVGGRLEEFLRWHRRRKFRTGREKARFLGALGPSPDSLYGVSKIFGEELCRLYTAKHGISCVCLRLAEVRPDDRPRPEDSLGQMKICRHADFVSGVRRAILHTRKPGLFDIRILISDDYRVFAR